MTLLFGVTLGLERERGRNDSSFQEFLLKILGICFIAFGLVLVFLHKPNALNLDLNTIQHK